MERCEETVTDGDGTTEDREVLGVIQVRATDDLGGSWIQDYPVFVAGATGAALAAAQAAHDMVRRHWRSGHRLTIRMEEV